MRCARNFKETIDYLNDSRCLETEEFIKWVFQKDIYWNVRNSKDIVILVGTQKCLEDWRILKKVCSRRIDPHRDTLSTKSQIWNPNHNCTHVPEMILKGSRSKIGQNRHLREFKLIYQTLLKVNSLTSSNRWSRISNMNSMLLVQIWWEIPSTIIRNDLF